MGPTPTFEGVLRMSDGRTFKSFPDETGFADSRRELIQVVQNTGSEIRRMRSFDEEGPTKGYRAYYVKMPHYLITGINGMGKTRFARSYARFLVQTAKAEGWPTLPDTITENSSTVKLRDEWTSPTLPRYDTDYYRMIEYRCSKRTTILDIDRLLYFAAAYGVILLDEAHLLHPDIIGWLLPILTKTTDPYEVVRWETAIRTDGRIAGVDGVQPQEHLRMGFQVIFMTTDEGKLSGPLFDRLKNIRLRSYSDEEMIGVVGDLVAPTEMTLDDEALRMIVSRSRSHPRTAAKLVESVRGQWIQAGYPDVLGVEAVLAACSMARIGPHGLSTTDVETLEVLAKSRNPIGAQNLAERCGLGKKANLEMDQKWMIIEGYVQVVSGGRIITEEGRDLLARYKAEMQEQGR